MKRPIAPPRHCCRGPRRSARLLALPRLIIVSLLQSGAHTHRTCPIRDSGLGQLHTNHILQQDLGDSGCACGWWVVVGRALERGRIQGLCPSERTSHPTRKTVGAILGLSYPRMHQSIHQSMFVSRGGAHGRAGVPGKAAGPAAIIFCNELGESRKNLGSHGA